MVEYTALLIPVVAIEWFLGGRKYFGWIRRFLVAQTVFLLELLNKLPFWPSLISCFLLGLVILAVPYGEHSWLTKLVGSQRLAKYIRAILQGFPTVILGLWYGFLITFAFWFIFDNKHVTWAVTETMIGTGVGLAYTLAIFRFI